jgi:hypothetical protein
MHLPTLSRRRLAGTAAIACAAALIPVASLAATASPSAPAAVASTPGCTTAGLVIWLTYHDGAAGTLYYNINFTNLSGHACTLRGHAGVSAVNLSGRQLGLPAGWGNARLRTVRLANGATATAPLAIAEVSSFTNPGRPCRAVPAAGLRVYPPNQVTSKVIPYPIRACSSRTGPVYMNVGPLQK